MDTVVPARRIRTVHLLLLLFSLCCFNGVITSAQQLHPDDVSVLRQIDAKLKVGWDFDLNPCSDQRTDIFVTGTNLRNVTCGDCDANNICRVTAILLKSQNLTGFLPPDFANLTSLVRLDLTRNYINGTIPPEWGSLPRLLQLDLGENRISGSIPAELGNITTLTSITMENNLLQGPIPVEIGKLENLTRLIISGNDFTGELPKSMGNLKNLKDFRIDGTGISGKIPDFIGNWTSLQTLYMQGTSLEGSFPSLSSLQKLSKLRVSDLKGVETFPSLGNLQMTHLVLRNCSLTGTLPGIVGGMTQLKVLDLSFNNFTGEIPSSYRNLLKQPMKYVFLNNNSLTGSLPNWNPGANQYIDVSYNFFNEFLGPPPSDCFDGNKNIIASFSSSESSTTKTCLRKNYSCEGNPTNYNLFINCGGSEFIDGDIQYEADYGNAVGPVSFPSSSGKWAFSSTGDFFDNDNMAYVATTNSIQNTNNTQLYMNARLSPSSLIYYGLCMQTGNYTVNLHFAEIMFIDGQTYYSVGRRFFDVYIQGQRVLKDFNIAEAANGTGRSVVKSFNATVGDGALKIQFQWAGKGTTSVPEKGVYGPLISAISVTPNFTPFIPNGRTISTGAIVGIVLASCLVILLIVLIVWFLILRRYRRYEGLKGAHLMTTKFTLRQIKSATGNFDRANKIGEGGFGPVFKGILPNGTLIAVKKLSARSKQGNREFINEIGLISSLQHPNLVKLYGCCVEEDQLLLVYEYMENNSLAAVLFGERKELKLDWRTRHNICLGVARGLAYLHEESRLKIVHRDIKANNVLLDKDLNAKISDFGLAKLDDDENTHMSTRIAGTRGYMAPEYATRGHLTDKADVYSFGIVLLEILSGKSHMIRMPDFTKVHLLDLAHNLEKNGRLHELVDENLGSDYSRDELVQIIKLALACASKSPSNRPAMSTVVSMLETGEFIQTQPVNQGLSDRQEPNDIYSIQELPHCSNDLSEDQSSRDPPTTTTTGTYSQSSIQLNMDSYLEAIPR